MGHQCTPERGADLLRYEHYDQVSTDTTLGAILLREAYYAIRPLLGVKMRRHLQAVALRGWADRAFPRWPVDRTVDRLMELTPAALTATAARLLRT